MSNNYEQIVEDLVITKWDNGEYEHEFYVWCCENMIHKDDAPDHEETFMEMKFVQLMEEYE